MPPQNTKRFDIGILTVVPEEAWAILEELGVDVNKTAPYDGDNYWEAQVRSRKRRRKLSVLVHCQGFAGNEQATLATSKMIDRFDVTFMVLCGIAAGRRERVLIGDVAYSRQVIDATIKVAKDGEQSPRVGGADLPQATMQMYTGFKLDKEKFKDSFERLMKEIPRKIPEKDHERYERFVATTPTVHDSAIYSDNLLLRDPAVLEKVASDVNQQTRIGEMEAAGFVRACEKRGTRIPWLVIRGVSDFGDDFKNDWFHSLAARAAAAYVGQFLRDGFDSKLLQNTEAARTTSTSRNPVMKWKASGDAQIDARVAELREYELNGRPDAKRIKRILKKLFTRAAFYLTPEGDWREFAYALCTTRLILQEYVGDITPPIAERAALDALEAIHQLEVLTQRLFPKPFSLSTHAGNYAPDKKQFLARLPPWIGYGNAAPEFERDQTIFEAERGRLQLVRDLQEHLRRGGLR